MVFDALQASTGGERRDGRGLAVNRHLAAEQMILPLAMPREFLFAETGWEWKEDYHVGKIRRSQQRSDI
jgi:hypothetical protein